MTQFQDLSRKERRQLARAVGFSATEADRVRDFGRQRFRRTIRRKLRRSKADRENVWSFWSSRKGEFPDEMLNQIIAWNDEQGLPDEASFGYRKMYFFFVEEIDAAELDDVLEDYTESR